MRKTNKRLMRLIKKHGLTTAQVAELCRVSHGTVRKWRQTDGTVSANTMPEGLLELLEIKLGEKDGKQNTKA
tara:strand:- start:8 stop:223 length:216 start_codon:yes stop_codon:yes gene_type:complete